MKLDWYSVPDDLSDADKERLRVSYKDMAKVIPENAYITEDALQTKDYTPGISVRLKDRILFGVPIYDPKDDSYGLMFCNTKHTVNDGQNRIRGLIDPGTDV